MVQNFLFNVHAFWKNNQNLIVTKMMYVSGMNYNVDAVGPAKRTQSFMSRKRLNT